MLIKRDTYEFIDICCFYVIYVLRANISNINEQNIASCDVLHLLVEHTFNIFYIGIYFNEFVGLLVTAYCWIEINFGRKRFAVSHGFFMFFSNIILIMYNLYIYAYIIK